MRQWSARAVEEANLFNPAFCAALLAQAADGFSKKSHSPLPFALAFLILPIALHHGTREALPHSTVTSLLNWIQENKSQLVDFPQRVSRLLPITREAIQFGIAHNILELKTTGELTVGLKHLTPTPKRTELFTAE